MKKILIEGKDIYSLFVLRYVNKRDLTPEQDNLLCLTEISYILSNVEDFFIPSWPNFDYVLELNDKSTIEIYWGDILMRKVQIYNSFKVECFFDRFPTFFLDITIVNSLEKAISYLTTTDNPCIPITVLP